MAQHIFTGTTPPSITPTKVGQHYIDTVAQRSYISTGTSSSADWKANDNDVTSVFGRTGAVTAQSGDYTAVQVGADPTGTATSAVATHVGLSDPHTQYALESTIGAANGIAPLDANSKVPAANLPSYVDDVEEYANFAAFPVTGETGKIYTALDTEKIYRWSGSIYIEISPSPGSTDAVPEGSTNLYFTTARVLATVLSGFSVGANAVIAATDTVLQAFGKTQGQLNALINRNITAGTGLNGGGNLSADRTLNHNTNNGSPGTFGSASQTSIVTVDSQGHATTVTQTAISILSSAVTDFATTVLNTVLTGLTFPFDTEITAADTVLSALGKLQGQISVWTEIVTTADVANSSSTVPTNITELAIPVVAGRKYRYELTAIYQSTAITTGLAVSVETPDTAVGSIAMTARMIIAADGTASEYAGAITALGDLVIGTSVPVINTSYICTVVGMFTCTTSGTIQPQIRREAGAGTTVTLMTGSCLLVREFQ